jgi:hypothetical protein
MGMDAHAAAPPRMHPCVRLRAPTMRPSPSHARVGTSAGICSQHTRHVQDTCRYLSMQSPGMQMGTTHLPLGTRVCPCIRDRSRAGADDALTRGMCTSATRSLRNAIQRWNTHIHSVCIPNACMYLYPCVAGYMDERIADAGPPHTRAYVLRPCARARVRVRSGALASAPTRVSAFRRRGPRVARLAGVPVGVGVQREHRRVEHRACHDVEQCMRRVSGPVARQPTHTSCTIYM